MKRKRYEQTSPPVPWIPLVASIEESPKSILSQQFLDRQNLLRECSRTKIISHKYLRKHIKSSVNIGSIFTSAIYQIHKRNLRERRKDLKSDAIISEEQLIHSSWKDKAQKDTMQDGTVTEYADFLPDSIVSLNDLTDGIWLWKKAQERYTKIPKKDGKIKKLRKIELGGDISSEKAVIHFYYMHEQLLKRTFSWKCLYK